MGNSTFYVNIRDLSAESEDIIVAVAKNGEREFVDDWDACQEYCSENNEFLYIDDIISRMEAEYLWEIEKVVAHISVDFIR